MMPRIQLDKDIKPLSEFRANVASLIEKVHLTKRPLVITQRGRSAAVILDVAEYESLLEKIELLQDIQLGEEQINQGLGVEHQEAQNQVINYLSK